MSGTSNDTLQAGSRKTPTNSANFAQETSIESRLLSLPGELRNEIYRLVCEHTYVRRSDLASFALLQVSSQTREEFSSILYGESVVLSQIEAGDHRQTTEWMDFVGKDLARKINHFHVNYLISPEEISKMDAVAEYSWHPAEVYQKHLEYSAFLLVEQLMELGVRTSIMQGRYDLRDPEQKKSLGFWWGVEDFEHRWNCAVIAFGKTSDQPEPDEA